MAGATTTQSEVRTGDSKQKTVALVFGAVFTLVGVLGPVLGGANDPLIVFGRNYIHDAVHIASGLAGLAAGAYASGRYAGGYLELFGVVTVAGFALTGLFEILIGLDTADDVLHLVLAVALLGAGVGLDE